MTKIRSVVSLYSFLLFFTACEVGTEKQQNAEVPVSPKKPSLTAYTDTLNKLNKNAPDAIERAVELYGVLAPDDNTGADSAASALMLFVNKIVSMKNDSLQKDSSDHSALLYPANNSLTERQKAVKSNLHVMRLKMISDGEGGEYVVPLYETILPGIKEKTSEPADRYLDLQAKEDTTPVFLDAGLAIEMTDLVDRLVLSEQLLSHNLPKQFMAEANRLNRFYTHALVMGSDNTPSVDFDSTTLNEEFRKGYDYLLAKYPSSKAAAKINVWLAVVTTGDKKKIDDYRRTLE